MIGIYKIISPSGKIYIGQSWNIKKRWREYKCGLGKLQRYLYNSFLKHGFYNHIFEIIHELPKDIEQEVLDRYEVFYWKWYKYLGFEMLNIKEPGKGGKISEETKLKMSKSKIGKPSKLKGIKKPKEIFIKVWKTRRKNGTDKGQKAWNKGLKMTTPSPKKGIPTSKEAIKKQIETKIKNGTTGKGKIVSEETKEKQRNAQKGEKNHRYGKSPWNKGLSKNKIYV